MSFSPITPAEIEVGRPITHGLWDKVRRNFDDHQTRLATVGGGFEQIPNGSLEMDANNDGIPDGWTRHLYPGGVGHIDTVHTGHGGRSYIFTHPGGVGNGGGFLDSDFVEVDPLVRKMLHFILWSNVVTGIRNVVQVLFFDRARVLLSHVNVYDSITNPIIPVYFVRSFTPPAGARFIRIRLTGGFTSHSVAGATVFDAVSLGSMPYWKVRGRDFTIAEHSTTSTIWVDAGTTHLNLEFNTNIQIIDLAFGAELRLSGIALGVQGHQRFRIGSMFSNIGTTESNVYAPFQYGFAPFFPDSIITSASLPITQQLATNHGGFAAIGRRLAGVTPWPASFEYIITS